MFQRTSNQPVEDIIPHNVAVRQAKLSPKGWQNDTEEISTLIKHPESDALNPAQIQAFTLYDSGFNVFPQPFGKKAGLPWKRLQYTRLHRTHPGYGLQTLFDGRYNLAIMCGKTSDNLFVIDCESQPALDQQIMQLRQRNIPIWAVGTARGGHIYLRCADGEVANIDKGTLTDIEIKGCRRYVLAPPSVHPTGVIYHWIAQEGQKPPIANLKTIDWLTDSHGKPVQLKLDQPHSRKSKMPQTWQIRPRSQYLSRNTRDYLKNGHNIPEGSRNNRLFNAACDMAGNNYSYTETLNQLTWVAQASGLTTLEIQNTVKSAFSKPRGPARPNTQPPQHTKQNIWENALAYAQHHQWAGRQGTSEKAVFLALIQRAHQDTNENGVFRASIREISATARIGTTATQKALKRLQHKPHPFIFRVSTDKTSGASLWRFSDNILQQGQKLKNNTLPPPPPWLSFSVSFPNSGDFLERGALGQTGYQLYCVMRSAEKALMPRALASLSDLTVNQVNYALRKLQGFGLVIREEGGWRAVICDVEQLDARVSSAAGTAGKGEARRRRYADERAVHAGRIIFAAQARFRFASQGASGVLKSSAGEVGTVGMDVKFWQCPNCGQMHFGDSPPDKCEMCRDFTTWREVVLEKDEVDPLLLLAFELGGVVGSCDARHVNPWLGGCYGD